MSQGLRNTEELLVLTCTPQDAITAIEWRPFKQGNKLGEIITAHNLRCHGLLQEKTPKAFVDCLPEIRPALTIGTCLAEETGNLDRDRLRRIKILLIDLDSDKHILRRLEPIKQQLAGLNRIFHLIQVSRSPRPVSWAGFFGEKVIVLKSDPEVITKQSDLEKFLHHYREAYENSWAGVIHNPLDAPCLEKKYREPYIHPSRSHFLRPGSEEGKSVERLYRAYRRGLPSLLSDIRDVAMARQIPEDQVANLGRSAAIQELLLTLITERMRPYPGYPISVNSIRMPLYDMPAVRPLEMREVQKARLLELKLLKPIRTLNPEQKGFLTELGFSDGMLTVIHFDGPAVWEKTSQLEGILKSESFSAELPSWPVKFENGQVGLNEVSFGLQIKESFSKDMEVQYEQTNDDVDVLASSDLS